MVDREILLTEDSLANVQELDFKFDDLLLAGQVTPGEDLLQAEEIFLDYPDFKLEELNSDTILGPSEVGQIIEVYSDVLPSQGMEITDQFSSFEVLMN